VAQGTLNDPYHWTGTLDGLVARLGGRLDLLVANLHAWRGRDTPDDHAPEVAEREAARFWVTQGIKGRMIVIVPPCQHTESKIHNNAGPSPGTTQNRVRAPRGSPIT
jgi:hypothetical protein